MFGISFEHILIVGIILVVLGPKRLPEIGNSMGKAIKNFKDSFAGLHEVEPKEDEKPKTSESQLNLADHSSTPQAVVESQDSLKVTSKKES